MNYRNINKFMFVAFLLNCVLSISAMEPAKPVNQKQALFETCAKGRAIDVDRLINAGADINARSRNGRTPLHVAAAAGNKAVVTYLIGRGADVNAQDKEGMTPERLAFDNKHLDVVSYFIKLSDLAFAEKNRTVFVNNESTLGYIRDYSKKPGRYNEIYAYSERGNAVNPGIFYHTAQGIRPVPKNVSKNMVENQLLGLSFSQHVHSKMHNNGDTLHNFPDAIEKEFGQWGRVVIDNKVGESLKDADKKFDLYITIPGRITEFDDSSGKSVEKDSYTGVFEFVVRKSPYVEKGFCVHRFFSPKGVVGADQFGAEARAAGQEELLNFTIQDMLRAHGIDPKTIKR